MALWITDSDPIELRPNATDDDLQAIIRAVYRQVLGNAHVMESERLASAESYFKNGDITVRGFVRAVAQSDRYRALFFDNSYAYRYIELNFKHLLGRAPHVLYPRHVGNRVPECGAQRGREGKGHDRVRPGGPLSPRCRRDGLA